MSVGLGGAGSASTGGDGIDDTARLLAKRLPILPLWERDAPQAGARHIREADLSPVEMSGTGWTIVEQVRSAMPGFHITRPADSLAGASAVIATGSPQTIVAGLIRIEAVASRTLLADGFLTDVAIRATDGASGLRFAMIRIADDLTASLSVGGGGVSSTFTDIANDVVTVTALTSDVVHVTAEITTAISGAFTSADIITRQQSANGAAREWWIGRAEMTMLGAVARSSPIVPIVDFGGLSPGASWLGSGLYSGVSVAAMNPGSAPSSDQTIAEAGDGTTTVRVVHSSDGTLRGIASDGSTTIQTADRAAEWPTDEAVALTATVIDGVLDFAVDGVLGASVGSGPSLGTMVAATVGMRFDGSERYTGATPWAALVTSPAVKPDARTVTVGSVAALPATRVRQWAYRVEAT